MYIAKYDISGIQEFIFSTPKLREQVGASRIVHSILYEKLPDCLGEGRRDWMSEGYDATKFGKSGGRIIFIGGGNAMVLYDEESSMNRINRDLSKEVFKLSNGDLRLCFASVEIKDINAVWNFNDINADLNQKLALVKNELNAIRTVGGFSIGAYDVNFEPITLYEDNSFGAASRMSKLDYTKNIGKVVNFEDYREEDRKSYVAVIHLDGNKMGQTVTKFVNQEMQGERLSDCFAIFRGFSKSLDQIFENVMIATQKDVFHDEDKRAEETSGSESEQSVGKTDLKKKMPNPIRLVVRDGDDITVIIDAYKAFAFAEKFVENLDIHKKENKVFERYFSDISVSIGMAFVFDKFPFYHAYDLAEELCGNVKKLLKTETYRDRSISGMDFEWIRSGMNGSISSFRKKNNIFRYRSMENGVDEITVYDLNIRPYLFLDDDKEYNSYRSFKNTREAWADENFVIARNKQKELRNAYGQGYLSANSCYRSIVIKLSDDAKALFELSLNKADESDIDTPFNKDNKARFFDVLDVMDIL